MSSEIVNARHDLLSARGVSVGFSELPEMAREVGAKCT
jgi:hypothetical protein